MSTPPPYVVYAQQANDPRRMPSIAVWAKRTYAIRARKELVYADDQLPIVTDPVEEELENHPIAETLAQTDLFPYKPMTDVVVKGEAHAPGGRAVPECDVEVRVGAAMKRIRVIGDRVIERARDGGLRFSDPEPFAAMPLTYRRAYGGIDLSVSRDEPETLPEMLEFLLPWQHPGAYPRNPLGRGYLVSDDPRTVDGEPLPNFEDPGALLTAADILVRDPANWWRMPLPQGLGWYEPISYPRSRFAGLEPPFPAPDHTGEVAEVRLGYIEKRDPSRARSKDVSEWLEDRIANGASPGLVLPHLDGREEILLRGLSSAGEIHVELPGEQPRIEVRFEKKRIKMKLEMHTLLIEPEDERISICWCALGRTPRLTPERFPTRDRLEWDFLEGFDITVDGTPYEHPPVRIA